MNKLYAFCRRLHRLLVVIMLSLGLSMIGSGLLLKYPVAAARLFRGIDLALIRFLHNQLSVIFTVVLICMSLTGIVLFLYPKWIRGRSLPTSAGQ